MSGYFDLSIMDWDDTIRANRFRHLVNAASVDEARVAAKDFTLAGCIEDLACPLLVMHGGRDAGIPASAARRIADDGGRFAEYVELPDGVHCFHNVAWEAYPLMTDWLSRHLTAHQPDS